MGITRVVSLRELEAEVVSNLGYLRNVAPELVVQPEFVSEVWWQYPDLVASILRSFGKKAGMPISGETKLQMRRLYCRTSKTLLEVLFDHMTRVRTIYKDNPDILKDVNPNLPNIEVDYSDARDFLAKGDDLKAEDVDDKLVDQTRSILERLKRSEKLLRDYEELIRNAVHGKKKSMRVSKLVLYIGILALVVSILTFVMPYVIGQPKNWEQAQKKQSVSESPDDTAATNVFRGNKCSAAEL